MVVELVLKISKRSELKHKSSCSDIKQHLTLEFISTVAKNASYVNSAFVAISTLRMLTSLICDILCDSCDARPLLCSLPKVEYKTKIMTSMISELMFDIACGEINES